MIENCKKYWWHRGVKDWGSKVSSYCQCNHLENNGEDVGIIELFSEVLKTVSEKVSMMIRLSKRLRGRNEGSPFLETLNLEHAWASDYSIKDCKKYLCCKILNKIVDWVETDFEGDDCFRCPPGFHCFFFPFSHLLHRTSAFSVPKSGRFDFITRAMGPLLLSLIFFWLIRFRRAECESRYECKTECFDKKICQIRLTLLLL